MQKIVSKLFFLVTVTIAISVISSFSPNSAFATGGTVSDGPSCVAIGGSWSAHQGFSSCTIPSLTINSGETLTIPPNIDLIISDTVTINSGGTLAINSGGTIEIDGKIINFGTINTSGDISMCNFITNNSGGIINNSGTIGLAPKLVCAPSITNNSGGTINNSGSIIIGTSSTNVGEIINSGTITNTGTIANSGFITNNSGGTISGTGTFTSSLTEITNTGSITNTVTVPTSTISSSYTLSYPVIVPSAVTLTINSGQTLTINSGGIVNNSGDIDNSGTISNSGTINNFTPLIVFSATGTINNNSGGTINNNSGGTIINPSSSQNNLGIFIPAGTINNIGSINNSGSISNFGITNNYGTINNNSGGTINNNSGGTISNTGIIINNSGGIIINNSGGIINNSGTLDLASGDTITFAGPSSYSGSFSNSGTLAMNYGSTLKLDSGTKLVINSGTLSIPLGVTLTINTGSTLTVNTGSTLSNSGTITSAGTITNNGTMSNLSGAIIKIFGGTLDNSGGTITNSGGTITLATTPSSTVLNNVGTVNISPSTTINSGVTLTIGSGTTLQINSGVTLSNSGTIANSGTITNSGTISNYGTINNNSAISNSGTINQYCTSTFTGNPVTGNPILILCNNTTTAVTPNPSSVGLGSDITFTATISDAGTPGVTPTGSVSWSDGGAGGSFHGGGGSCSITSTGARTATCTERYASSNTLGPVTITATYSGDSYHKTSSGTSSLTVLGNLRTTSTSIQSSFPTVTPGSGTILSASVTDTGSGKKTNPSGTVSWTASVAGGSFGSTSCNLFNGSTQTSCSVMYTAPSTGPVTINATYLGDGIHTTSWGTFLLGVGSGQTFNSAVSVPSSASGSVLIQYLSAVTGGTSPYTYSWILMRPGGSSAHLSSTTVPNPTFVPDVAGTFTARLTATDSASHTNNRQASVAVTSTTTTLTTIGVTPTQVPWGTSITITGSLTTSSGAGVAGKTITFDDSGGTAFPSTVTNLDGTFSSTGTAPSIISPSWQVQAHFAGDAINSKSDGGVIPYGTIPHNTSLALTSFGVPWGQPVSFVATLTDASAGGTISARTISFNGTGVIGVANAITGSNGVATGTGTAPSVVADLWTEQAHFAGDALYNAADFNQRFNTTKHVTSVSLAPPANVAWGRPTSFNATLSDTTTGVAVSARTINFTGEGVIGVANTITGSNGIAKGNGTAPSTVSTSWRVQSHFAGDSLYLKADSLNQTYNTLVHNTSLSLVAPANVPWGRPTSFNATLTDSSAGGAAVSARAISYTGTGVIGVANANTTTNGVATGTGTAPGTVASGWTAQSHFAGDSLYNAADSTIPTYNTIKHTVSLALTKPANIPWTRPTAFTATLADTSAGGAAVSARTISYTGTGVISVANVNTGATGVAIGRGTSPSTIATNWTTQAHFAGDTLYNSVDSTTQTYNTLVHNTNLILTLTPTSVLHGAVYNVTGTLRDATANVALGTRTVTFTATAPITIPSQVTTTTGAYSALRQIAPGTAGSYSITSHFAANSLYGASNSPARTLTVT